MVDSLAPSTPRGSSRDGAPTVRERGRRLTGVQRRSQLFGVALSLFAERGYAATTMDDIAEAAGVTKPLVYQHFESKRALYLEIANDISDRLIVAISEAVEDAPGPRQQVEQGFAAYFSLVVNEESAFRLLYGRDAPDDPELGEALRRVEDTIAKAIDPLIDAGLNSEHRLLLAYAVVGMAEGVSRFWMDRDRTGTGGEDPALSPDADAARLATRLADMAWAGLRQVHPV